MHNKTNIREITRYILQFLLGTDSEDAVNQIGYTSEAGELGKYKLVVKPSRFFDDDFYGTEKSLPVLPLSFLEETPLLFGEPKVEERDGTIILHADIIASTYFLVSRYEEMIRPTVRDLHGRFIGKESLACKGGFIDRAVVDEYGKLLRKHLSRVGISIAEPPQKIKNTYLTHDIDMLAHYKNAKSVVGALARCYNAPKNAFTALKTYFGSIESDPWFTFPWLFRLAGTLDKDTTKSIVFIKPGGGNLLEDYPHQHIADRHYKKLFDLCEKEKVEIGLHPSYQAGLQPDLIAREKAQLEKAVQKEITLNRNHYLCSREPDDFNVLIENGFTDDFTMGFADVAGFRLGTCRPVRWIDPKRQKLTSLTLHPLLIMDNTLSDSRYMNLKADEAFSYCKRLIDEVKEHKGEVVLLFHNTSFDEERSLYNSDLYTWLINYLAQGQ